MTQPMTSDTFSSSEPPQLPARLLALSTLQILANSTEFTSVKSISLETLTHVAARYLELLGEAARASVDLCSRTQVTAWDISGVLESLHGPGALSELHNWCIDNVDRYSRSNRSKNRPRNQVSHSSNQAQDELDKIAQVSRNIVDFRPTSPLQPIASISFLPLTDAEVAALDRAGESDAENDHPSPLASSTSCSSEDDSDMEFVAPIPQLSSPLTPLSSQAVSLTLDGTNIDDINVEQKIPDDLTVSNHKWRSNIDIPAYIPSYFPPFPGLERVDSLPENENPQTEEARDPIPDQQSFEAQDPYLCAIPFLKSQLHELHGEFLSPKPSASLLSPTGAKKRRLSGSLEGFLQTYNFMLEEKQTNKAAEEKKFLRPNPARHQILDSHRTPAIHDTMFGAIPIGSIKPSRWSAGWIPHPPVKDGQLLPAPELKPHGHTPLPIPVTMAVPIQFPANPLVNQPHPQIPSLIPRMFQKIAHGVRGDTFTLFHRMSRIAPPSELGPTGEPLPYRIQEITSAQQANSDIDELNRPKYMEWGFQWPAHEGREPLPPAKQHVSDFKAQDFPGMPKTTAEKARLARKEKTGGG
ncbi:hypothetical protein BY996DRAFT_6636803 [Phakopsora pachyrhizi]|uniref:Bromodomain associated domain-containing protein n=1 Tax=Phakopsora pachyrhizi TaxID=170000 RepID=A0AAV0AJE9_PHAPC|nr:hypothetical protein BY996DRAFT_6636803 [Phakopsora pachyrhizi]CAH7667684.1 hypothetical protein PPACK8108_LOCUS2107 [Phakopsora pachyrhizi]